MYKLPSYQGFRFIHVSVRLHPRILKCLKTGKIPMNFYIGTIVANFWFVMKGSRLGWSNAEKPTNSSVFPMNISCRTHIQLGGTNSRDEYKHAVLL
jgi:hypothetical protein